MTDPQTIASALIAAQRQRAPIAPFSRRNPFLDTDTAYKAQALFVGHRRQAGEHVVGLKLGMTSKVKRDALGIQEPVFGRLTSGMVLAPGEPLRVGELIHPRAEPEIALLIGRRISAGSGVATVLAAIDAVLPAIEVFDSRYRDPFRLADSIADNVGAARFALGGRARRPAELPELHVLGCVFRHADGLDTAAGGAAMGHPAAAVAWLASALAARGEELEAGSIVLSGGLTASAPLRTGDQVMAEFDGLGSVGLRCA